MTCWVATHLLAELVARMSVAMKYNMVMIAVI
jgi:hypothetical protein